jgi:hypothetical protein
VLGFWPESLHPAAERHGSAGYVGATGRSLRYCHHADADGDSRVRRTQEDANMYIGGGLLVLIIIIIILILIFR